MTVTDRLTLAYLETALPQPGCPVCRLARVAETRYLKQLLWENVNDLGTRIRLSESLGFCQRHAWQLVYMESDLWGAPLDNSIIYEDLVGQIQRGLVSVPALPVENAESGWWQQVLASLRRRLKGTSHRWAGHVLSPHRGCPACESGQLMSEGYAVNLARMLAHAERLDLYATSDGLCLPHLRLALQLADSVADRARLIQVTQARLTDLRENLREFGRKQAWQYRFEIVTGNERTSAERAVAFFVGSDTNGAHRVRAPGWTTASQPDGHSVPG